MASGSLNEIPNCQEIFAKLCRSSDDCDAKDEDGMPLTMQDIQYRSNESLLKDDLELLCSLWGQLDQQYQPLQEKGHDNELIDDKKCSGSQSQLMVPPCFNIYNPELNDSSKLHLPGLSEEHKIEYLDKLKLIFQSIPRAKHLPQFSQQSHLASANMKQMCDSADHNYYSSGLLREKNYLGLYSAGTKVLHTELLGQSSIDDKPTNDTCASSLIDSLPADTMIFSLAVHCAFSDNPTQRFDLCGQHSLIDVWNCIHCVQEQLLNSDPEPTDAMLVSCNVNFFLIDGIFYVDDSTQSIDQHEVLIQEWISRQVEHGRLIFRSERPSTHACLNFVDWPSRRRKREQAWQSIPDDDTSSIERSSLCNVNSPVVNFLEVGNSLPPSESSWTSILNETLRHASNSGGTKQPRKSLKRNKQQDRAASESSVESLGATSHPSYSIDARSNTKSTFTVGTATAVIDYRRHDMMIRLGLDPRPDAKLLIKSIQQANLDNIGMSMGKRHLFIHLGDCEHFVYLLDCHQYHPALDLQQLSDYPRFTFQSRMHRRVCIVCEIMSASKVVYGDKLADQNPAFYCSLCFQMLHYSQVGELLYDDFLVYPYMHDME